MSFADDSCSDLQYTVAAAGMNSLCFYHDYARSQPTLAPTSLASGPSIGQAVRPRPYSYTRMKEGVTTTTLKFFSKNDCVLGVIDGQNKLICETTA